MKVTIGTRDNARELTLDVEQDSDEIVKRVDKALADGASLVLNDEKDRRLIIPAAAIAYVETGEGTEQKVGFSLT